MDIRQATLEDIPAIFHVRFSVRENAASEERLRQRGITPESLERSLRDSFKGWVGEDGGQVVGFCIADSRASCIWALFLLPEYQGKGLGRSLLECAVSWLWECGAQRTWLNTGPETRAAGFYLHLGWQPVAITETGEIRFELERLAPGSEPWSRYPVSITL